MKPRIRSPYLGLVGTGVIASVALITESQLSLPAEVHFLLQFVWLGVVGAALLAFAILFPKPESKRAEPQDFSSVADIPEWYDEDRIWLQAHPDSTTKSDSR